MEHFTVCFHQGMFFPVLGPYGKELPYLPCKLCCFYSGAENLCLTSELIFIEMFDNKEIRAC